MATRLSRVLHWPYWKFRQPWPDHVQQYDYLDWETQRDLAYKQIDKGGFGYWTVLVAGIGFLTDAYDIFAVNTVIPMMGVVFWGGKIPPSQEILINLATLTGTFFGQWTIGILADRYGRKKMYGFELVIITIATILQAVAHKGLLSSTNIIAWLVIWRFIMGIGIGGDYPLSSVIVAEFAPRRHRAKMLAAVFFMQPLGVLIANIVTIVALFTQRNSIPSSSKVTSCAGECRAAVDTIWRWVVGIGAVPPALAIFLRWWIPESPRYTLEVEKNPHKARRDVQNYFESLPPDATPSTASQNEVPIAESSSISPSTANASQRGTLHFGEEAQEMKDLSLPNAALEQPETPLPRMVQKENWAEWWSGFKNYLATDNNWTDLAGTSLSWMTLDFSFYFLGVNSPKILGKLWDEHNTEALYSMLMANSYRALIATSIGAIIGGVLFIQMSRFRWHLQVYGFWILAALFVAVGVCFVTLLGSRYFAAIIVLYCMCSLFFNLGPNTSTFVIAAEVFPTKYRCTCHGISAAAGKLGSIIAQVFLAYAKFGHPGVSVKDGRSTWLGWVLLVFTLWMVFGAVITKIWVPNPCDIWGRSRRLEDLGLGKAARKRMDEHDKSVARTFDPGTPRMGV